MPEQREMYRPYLAIAVFCEKVLKESDGVLSIIRVIDRLNVSGPADEMPPQTFRMMLMLLFKAGFMRGAARVKVVPHSPSGSQQLPSFELPLFFEGDDDRGTGIGVEIVFPFQEAGLYWFDIKLMDEIVTRIPFRVVYQKTGGLVTGTVE